MQKVKKAFILLTPLGAIFALLLAVYFWKFSPQKHEQKIQLNQALISVQTTAIKIENQWRLGLFEEIIQSCPEFQPLLTEMARTTHGARDLSRFLRCDVKALNCALSQLPKLGELRAKKIGSDDLPYVQLSYHSQRKNMRTKGKEIFFALTDQKTNHQSFFSVEDTCLDIPLEQKIYTIGSQRPGQLDWLWDNDKTQVYVDRYLVSRGDFYHWIKFHDPKTAEDWKVEGLEFYEIADNIPRALQEKYCLDHGKELLNSHYADAASFYPSQLDAEVFAIIPRGPYPQGRRRQNSKLGLIREDKKTADQIDWRDLCQEIHLGACQEHRKLLARDEISLSWSGIFHVLGGVMESVKNPKNPEQNLIPSSFYFPYDSEVHQVGIRGSWDGESFVGKNLSLPFNLELDQEKVSIGFRCQGLGGHE